MDSHLEVVLEYVTDLADKSRKTIWYEIPNTTPKDKMIVFITDDSKVGAAAVIDNKLQGFTFDKDQYERASGEGFNLKQIYKRFDTFVEATIPEMGRYLTTR